MPEVTTKSGVTKTKTQPWRAVWPPSQAVSSTEEQLTRKAKNGGSNGSGTYGYDDKDEDSTPKK